MRKPRNTVDHIARDEYKFRLAVLQRLKKLEISQKFVVADLQRRVSRLEKGVLGTMTALLVAIGGLVMNAVQAWLLKGNGK